MNTKNVKVTMKNSKADMLRFLEAVQSDIRDKDITERVQYTLDNAEKSKKSEVFEVVEEVQTYLVSTMTGDDFKSEEVPVPTENEVKKTLKKPKDKKSAPTENEVKTAKKPKVSPAPKKTEKSEKKSDIKVETTPQLAGAFPIAKVFPKTLEVEGIGTLSVAPDKYKSMEDIATALENGKQFYFVTYWTKRQLKEFCYSDTFRTNAVKEFPNDLDILEPCYYCNGLNRIWANSLYTEAMLMFEASDIEHVEDTNPYNGEKFKVRVSNGMEFELYELVESGETTTEK